MSGNKQSGFTLVELTIVVSVMAIVGVVFIGIVSNFFVIISRNNALTEMTINSQNLLRTTVENIRYGDGIRQTNQISDANAPVGGWSTSDTNFVIIIAVPALDGSRNYIIDSSTGSPYMNELIYYKSGTTLMERRLANPSASGNRMTTTCPTNLASTTCPADLTLAPYVNTMTFSMYDQDAAATTDPTLARSIKITLNMQRNAPGNPINLTTSTQVTLRNRF
ncbi:MAG TPA: type II secretion system protein [Candidatus Saccharimonadia bacterium]|nr:type II secretion system protein [Candidatus Saccharimonadia bacterium]